MKKRLFKTLKNTLCKKMPGVLKRALAFVLCTGFLSGISLAYLPPLEVEAAGYNNTGTLTDYYASINYYLPNGVHPNDWPARYCYKGKVSFDFTWLPRIVQYDQSSKYAIPGIPYRWESLSNGSVLTVQQGMNDISVIFNPKETIKAWVFSSQKGDSVIEGVDYDDFFVLPETDGSNQFEYWECALGNGITIDLCGGSAIIPSRSIYDKKNFTIKANYISSYSLTANTLYVNYSAQDNIKFSHSNYKSYYLRDNNGINHPLSDPYAYGYTFDGWYKDGKKVARIVQSGREGGTIDLVAHFTPIAYNVSFVSRASTFAEEQVLGQNATLVPMPPLIQNGERFVGWKNEYNGKVYLPGDSISYIDIDPDATSTVFTALWEKLYYTLTFQDNDNPLYPQIIYFNKNTETIICPTLTKAGYNFKGWSDKNTYGNYMTQVVPSRQIWSMNGTNLTLYAMWSPVHSISYNLNDGTNPSTGVATSFDEHTETALPTPARTGYNFKGWGTDPSCANVISSIALGTTQDISLWAKWEPVNYAISYSGTKDAANNNPSSYTVEQAVKLSDPSRRGYVFNGWSPGDSIAKGSTGAKTFTASWKPRTYSITYNNLNGAANPQASITSYNIETDTITLLDAERKGYTFHGWYSDPALKTRVTSIPKGSCGDVSLYANISKDTYSITYGNMAGAVNNASNPSAYQVDTPDIIFAAPVKTGYTFGGWYSDAACTKGREVTGIPMDSTDNVTVYAKWTINVYNIAYENIKNKPGAVNHEGNPSSYTVEDAVTFKDPERRGYDFTGWFKENTLTDRTTGIEKGTVEDQTIYAGWDPTVYNIRYHNLEGISSDPGNPAAYTIEDDDIILAAPDRHGYDFRGWYDDKELTVMSDAIQIPAGSCGDKDFYAEWGLVTYDIVYRNTKNVINNSPISYTIEDDDILLDDLKKTGYVFNGWVTSGDAVKGAVLPHGSYGNKVYTADWTVIDYPIVYHNLEGIAGDNPNPSTYTIEDDAIVLNAPAKRGYTFGGWYLDEALTDKITSIPGRSHEPFTLYAEWNIDTYSIVYENMEEADNGSNPITYDVLTDDIVLGDAVRDGYTFLGWKEDGAAPAKDITIPKGSTGNRVFRAVWEADPCTAVFDANGGAGAMADQKFYADDILAVAENKFTREGFTFAGWSTDKDADPWEIRIFDRSKVRNISSKHGQTVILYAIWVDNRSFEVPEGGTGDPSFSSTASSGDKPVAAITYDLSGGEIREEGNPFFYKNEQTGAITLVNPQKAGYEFAGWTGTDLDDLTMEVIIPAGAKGNRWYKAHYKGETHNVTFYIEAPEGKEDVASIIFHSEDLECGTAVSAPNPAPSREGYDFAGWSRDNKPFVVRHKIFCDEYWVADFTEGSRVILDEDPGSADHFVPTIPGAVAPGEERPGVVYRCVTMNYLSPASLPLTSTIKVEDGSVISVSDPGDTREKIFKEWDDEDGSSHDFAQPVVEDITINADYLRIHALSAPESLIRNGSEYGSIYMVKGQKLALDDRGYQSDDKTTVTVSKKGVITARKAGMAAIDNGRSRYLVYVSSPRMARKKIKLTVGDGWQVQLNDLDENLEVSWKSSRPTVAQVVNGYVYAVGKGTAAITAAINGITRKCTVTVIEKPVNPSRLEEGMELDMYPGQKVKPIFADGFRAKGSEILNIDREHLRFYPKTGTLMAMKQGRTTVTLKKNGVQKSFVVVIRPMLERKDIYVEEGSTATIAVPGVSASKIEWSIVNNAIGTSTGDPSLSLAKDPSNGEEAPVIATVRKNRVRGVTVGDGVLKGAYKGITYEMNLHVYSTALITDDNLAPAVDRKGDPIADKYILTIRPGASYVINDNRTREELLNWKSSKTSVAVANELGIITGVKEGTAVVTAKIGRKTISVRVVVSAEAPSTSVSGDFSYKRVELSGGWSAFIGRDGRYVYDYDDRAIKKR